MMLNPSRADLQEIKIRMIAWLQESRVIDRSTARHLRRVRIDDILGRFFALTDAVQLTLSDGRKVTVVANRTALQ